MAEWNLSVELRGQGNDLARTLRQSATQARALSNDINTARRDITRLRQEARGNIRLGISVDTARFRREVQAAARGAGGQRITIPLGVDGAHLRQDIRRALSEAGAGADLTVPLHLDGAGLSADLQRNITRAATALNRLTDEAQNAGQALERLGRHADSAGDQLDGLRNHAAAAAVSLRSINTAAGRSDSRLETLSGRTQQLRTDFEALNGPLDQTGTHLERLRGNVGGLSQSSSQVSDLRSNLLLLAGVGATALAPLAASVAPLALKLGAASASAAAFGVAVAGQIGPLSDTLDAQTKLEDATTQYGAASDQAATASQAYQAQLSQLPAATQRTAAAFGVLKSDFQAWSDSLAGVTMTPITHGIETLDALLPRTTPMVKAASTQLDRLVTVAAGGINTTAFDHLFDAFSDRSTNAIAEITDDLIHLLRVLSGDEPAGSQVLREFLAYAKSVGPQATETFRSLAQALLHLLQSASQTGVGILTLVNALAGLVSAIPPGVLTAFLTLATTIKLAMLAAKGGAVFAALGTQITAARTAAASASGPIAAASAAFTGLSRAAKFALVGTGIGLLVLALTQLSQIGKSAPPDVDKLTSSLRDFAKTGKAAGEVARVFGTDMSKLSDAVRTLSRPSNFEKVDQFLTKLLGMDSTPVSRSKEVINGLDDALANLVKSGNADLAKAAFDKLSKRLGNLTPKELRKQLDDYQSALKDQAFEAEVAAQSMGLFGQQAQKTSAQLDAQKASADGLRQSITALNDAQRGALGGMIGLEQAIDDASKAAKTNRGALTETNGQLNLNTQKARDAASALSDLAAKTDDAAGKARENGESWQTVNAIYSRGRAALVSSAQAMGLTKSQAEALAASILKIPAGHTTKVKMDREDAIAGLQAVQDKIKATPGAKSVTVKALTASAEQALKDLGFKVTHMKNGSAKVTVPTGTPKGQVAAIQRAIDGLHGKTVTNQIRTEYVTVGKNPLIADSWLKSHPGAHAKGGPIRGYASGGDVQAFPGGGYIQGPGNGTSDSILGLFSSGPAMVSNTEYVIRADAVRKYGLAFLDAVNSERLPKFAGGGPLASLPRYATGGGMDFTYSNTGSSILSLSDLISASADKNGNFSLSTFSKKLASANNQLDAWRKNLATVASRAGQDVADALAAMGQDGVELTKKMATGSSKYLNQMATDLRNLANAAKATLGEYTSEMKDAVADQTTFQNNLAKLAGQGYGDLAGRLAAQNDADAAALAAAAVKDKSKAAAANSASKAANTTLSGDELAELVQIIAAVTKSTTGIHDVAATTKLGEDEIIAIATKARSQISSSLGSRATRFLADLGKAQKGLAYADGGIRAGLYATQAGLVRFAEPSTGGEAYIPLGANKRKSATAVLGDVAGRFGLGLTDASAGRVIVIQQPQPLVGTQNWHVTSGGNAVDTARQVEARAGYQLRRLARGGAAR
ncbi:hypothetical protein ACFV3R_25395 [Streptomyces sp. NPDC059740]|uniref:hypothetical protein n=1 Tax=Streptomyces sp. NPDC059740 TaxID=3346926 RepID=UPI00364B146D